MKNGDVELGVSNFAARHWEMRAHPPDPGMFRLSRPRKPAFVLDLFSGCLIAWGGNLDG